MTRLDLADGLRLIHQVDTDDYFGHDQHLQFAWALLDETSDVSEAERVACLTIRHLAELAGNPGKFHHTVTVFWIRALGDARSEVPTPATLVGALARHPDLADPTTPERHWSDLDSLEARTTWVEPDLKPLK